MFTFRVKGLNIAQFLKALNARGVVVKKFVKLAYNEFEISISKKHKSQFDSLAKLYHYEYNLKSIPTLNKCLNFAKKNLVFLITACLMLSSFAFFSQVVLRVEIFGLENIEKQEILEVLDKNNYKVGKFKSSYDLDNVENVLKQNIPLVSLASAVIKGSTLIVNINEKIDNSPYLYDYPPIVSPFNAIVEDIILISGSITIEKNNTAKQDDIIIAPYIVVGEKIIQVPARAKVTLYVELFAMEEVSKDLPNEKMQKVIEENELKLYNELSCYAKQGEFTTQVNTVLEEDYCKLAVTISGRIVIEN